MTTIKKDYPDGFDPVDLALKPCLLEDEFAHQPTGKNTTASASVDYGEYGALNQYLVEPKCSNTQPVEKCV